MSIKLCRIKEVSELTGLKPSSIYKQIRLQNFPPGIKITARSTAWSNLAVEAWVTARIEGTQLPIKLGQTKHGHAANISATILSTHINKETA